MWYRGEDLLLTIALVGECSCTFEPLNTTRDPSSLRKLFRTRGTCTVTKRRFVREQFLFLAGSCSPRGGLSYIEPLCATLPGKHT